MKDKKGYLPAHVACSRHCSPAKLRMLLKINPNALIETTNDNQTLFSLAQTTATPAHPNHALIDEIRQQLQKNVNKIDTDHSAAIHTTQGFVLNCSYIDNDDPERRNMTQQQYNQREPILLTERVESNLNLAQGKKKNVNANVVLFGTSS
jgi:hypothetical protein